MTEAPTATTPAQIQLMRPCAASDPAIVVAIPSGKGKPMAPSSSVRPSTG
jgi:hypothetical protein